MPPSGKRKRPERPDGNETPSRPSPHRPQNLPLAHAQQQSQQQNNARGGGRRASRPANRGGYSAPASPSVTQPSPSAMSPPSTLPPASKSQLAAPANHASINNKLLSQSKSVPVNDSFVFLTPQRADTWSSGGRAALIEDAVQAAAQDDEGSIAMLFEEIIEASVMHSIGAQELGTTVRDILAAAPMGGDMLEGVSLFLSLVSNLTEKETAQPSVKAMLEASEIDPMRLREELEEKQLVVLNLVRPSFGKVAIRKATQVLYRQANYNLLREEPEGYSKLVTEYFTTVNDNPPSEEVVTETFQRVTALVGAFDLDVGRVLDITLDVFANLLVKHTKFFVKLLRVSSWWPETKAPHGIEWEEPTVSPLPQWALPGFSNWYYSEDQKNEQLRFREQRDQKFWRSVEKLGIKAYFELGARRITSNNSTSQRDASTTTNGTGTSDKKAREASDFEEVQKWAEQWMAETETLPPSGNRTAAQLLGFKLRFYASDARDAHDTLPDNLIYLAALLIKIGFISLVDLYPHLYPLDEDMEAHKEKLFKIKQEKDKDFISGSGNALTRASALPDDSAPQSTAPPAPVSRLRASESKTPLKLEAERGTPPPAPSEPKDELPEPVDQKVALLRSLLCIGAIPEALFILGRYPWLLEVYPDLHTYLFRLVHHSLSKVYESTRHMTRQETAIVSKKGPAQAAPRTHDFVPRRTLRWAKLEERDAGDGIDYRFYWEDWADNVPICQTVDDVFLLFDTLLTFIGAEFGKDDLLLTKLFRIAQHDLARDASPANMRRWITISGTHLAPALSFHGNNAALVNEAWDLFKQFDILTRWAIYNSWFTGAASRKPALNRRIKQFDKQLDYALNRTSASNDRARRGLIAGLGLSLPGELALKFLKEFSNKPNMVPIIVNLCSHLGPLGYDCLNWAIVTRLQQQGKPTMQDNGMFTSMWLQQLSEFIGKAYGEHSSMDPLPILQFVTYRFLMKKEVPILNILDDFVEYMAGIKSMQQVKRLELSAGIELRAAFFDTDTMADTRNRRSVGRRRLVSNLKKDGLLVQLLVGLAQEVERYAFRDDHEDMPLKVLSSNLDRLRSSFASFLDLLRTSLSSTEFDTLLPNIIDLLSVYHIDHSIAFTICRASLSETVAAARVHKRTGEDVDMSGMEDGPITNGTHTAVAKSPQHEATVDQADVEMVEAEDISKIVESAKPADPSKLETVRVPSANRAVAELASTFATSMPETYGERPCLEFYISFWVLSPLDVFPNLRNASSAYSTMVARLKQPLPGQSRPSSQALARIPKLQQEEKTILTCFGELQESLKEEMHNWFDGIPMLDKESARLHDAILQDCFLPRILMSFHDAIFSAAMLKIMHEIGVPGFRTMKFLDNLFKQEQLANTIFMCTAEQAVNLGVFLADVLQYLDRWHKSEQQYLQAAHGRDKSLPGFGRSFNEDRSPKVFLDYEEFRHILHKWHSNLCKALQSCFKDREYMQMTNAISVLGCLIDSKAFPKTDLMGSTLSEVIDAAAKTEERKDLHIQLIGMHGRVQNGKRFWVPPHKFHNVSPPPPSVPTPTQAVTASKSSTTPASTGSDRPRTPAPASAINAKLNATAPSFNPPTTTTTSLPATNGKVGAEDEDGEVKDKEQNAATVAAPGSTQRTPSAPSVQPKAANSNAQTSQKDAGVPTGQTTQSASNIGRPDSRGGVPNAQSSQPPHTLPPRPNAPPARTRPNERPSDRQMDLNSRHDARGPPAAADYGRPNQASNAPRDFGQNQREMSPGRRPRGRTPERRDQAWARDPRDVPDGRDYHDNRPMRLPPQDARANQSPYNGRDSRDPRDIRDRRDGRDSRDPRDGRDVREIHETSYPRGPPAPSEGRGRLHSGPSGHFQDNGAYRRDAPPQSHLASDRNGNTASRPPNRTPTTAPVSGGDRLAPTNDGAHGINPERAALINNDHGRTESFRSERDSRGERGSRPQSPPRGPERSPSSYPSRNDAVREYRDDRNSERAFHEQTPPHAYSSGRERREEPAGPPPTGPRGGRNDTHSSSRVSRDMFMPSQGPSRASGHQTQDPNYGRLNTPNDSIPSGPRSKPVPHPGHFARPNDPAGFASDRREPSRRDSTEMHSHQQTSQAPAAAPAAPVAPAAAQTTRVNAPGVHPSRLSSIDMSNPPSGPRGSLRTPQGPAASPVNQHPPTGPASSVERNSRTQDRNPLHAINSVLTSEPPQVRGRGGTRANGLGDSANMPSPGGSSSHPSTPNPLRGGGGSARTDRLDHSSHRLDNRSFDDGRHDSRGHRESRRNDRGGRPRSRSPDRTDRRPDERSTRNGPIDRPRNDEQDRMTERGNGPVRERRPGDRDGSRRERDRDAEQPPRDGRERREHVPRDDGRNMGRGEELGPRRGGGPPPVGNEPSGWTNQPRGDPRGGEHRGRGGPDRREERGDRRREDPREPRGGGGSGRKRDRGQEEAPHGDSKRPRRSGA